jgi:hypothetical protein
MNESNPFSQTFHRSGSSGKFLRSRTDGYPSVRFVKIYGGGRHEAHHGTIPATERATGEPLRQIGIAYADDVAASSAATRQALRAWADILGPRRGDGIASQIMPEIGAIQRAKFSKPAALGAQGKRRVCPA